MGDDVMDAMSSGAADRAMPSPRLLVHDEASSQRKSLPSRRGAIRSPSEGIRPSYEPRARRPRRYSCRMPVSLLGAAEIRALAAELDVTPTKKLGQNFVVDANTVRKIVQVARVLPGDSVVEV